MKPLYHSYAIGRKALFLVLSSVVLLFSCEKEEVNPTWDLIGEWNYEYHILEDGSKSTTGAYALLIHTYSNGFVLYGNKTGNTISSDGTNAGEFDWDYKNPFLRLRFTSPDGSTHETDYILSGQTENSMFMQSHKNNIKYFFRKK